MPNRAGATPSGPSSTPFANHRSAASAGAAALYTSAAVRELWSQVMAQFVEDAEARVAVAVNARA
ncbi:hypothetical protein [Nocardia sp. NPDC004604]|uniref:hypothetical protein n=1 Tax=Nocardia sp. NPDC004604 TaxID=3157013 RepID=UPI0033BC6131